MKQRDFIQAALTPTAPIPNGLLTPDGKPAEKRFNVYRNNIIVSLKESLSEGFPAVKSLVGDDFFNAMAGEYLRQSPPKKPIIPIYGEDFSSFIDRFTPAKALPYLADVAKLEYLLRESYHAKDEDPIPTDHYQDPEFFLKSVTLAASVKYFSSRFPVSQIRSAALGGDKPTGGAEDILITRSRFDPKISIFPTGTCNILKAIEDCTNLETSLSFAPQSLDVTTFFKALIDGAAITKIMEISDD